MTREFPDELLSAFLDGELTAPERELVEQRLTALRDIVDDKSEGIVLRLKVPKGVSIVAAIEQVGIPSGTSPSAAAVDSAYNGPLEAKHGLRILRGKENLDFVAATNVTSE